MSDLLSIGASGVRAYQTALTAVGENIANVATDGYSRRTVTTQEVSPAAGLSANKVSAGSGVVVLGIARSTDVYATAAVRSATSDLSRTQTGATWLSRIESTLTGDQVQTRLTSFFTAARTLASDPSSNALRATMLEAARSTASAFSATNAAFDQVQSDFDGQARQAAQDLSSLAVSLVRVNDGLGRTQAGTAAAAQLTDQRDQILTKMSALADITSTTDSLGRATVRLGDRAGPVLAAPDVTGSVTYQRGTDGSVSFKVAVQGELHDFIPTGGSMAGMLDGAERINATRGAFNQVAKDFVNTVNTLQAGGQDVNGQQGAKMFALTDGTANMSLLLTSGSGIAAASNGAGSRNADNLTLLEQARSNTSTGNFETRLTQIVTGNATTLKQRQTVAEAQTAISDGAKATLSAASGVTLDSEAVTLMRFQQAYSASSRVIQAARDTFQSILELR
ncbi:MULTISPECIES: flagellar hook-associated protein FlgK [unclassified Sphingomonas]|uniref:flagellar hook-associated protein FlgK n=1 Tax=unclassified Sphingomonas TaxID=196159 RepID=UPI00285E846A|nr:MULTISPECIES: flagellar hook-associated protein FlgK [unclassified Sphingomonas]MDR6114042.1 flagellar hook-associated protein 1 FlgK [Sphingomonas sp. SORGH_AS_0789]MDR6148598.1 flagellar hook-associated protein 1 FlgK [Sphingomonas sp. SORGH_AS_0742]